MAEGFEEEHDDECEDHREVRRLCDRGGPEENVGRGDAEGVDRRHHRRGRGVEEAFAQDDPDVQQPETDDGVRECDGHQDQWHHTVEQESLGVEE